MMRNGDLPMVEIQTELGVIVIEVDTEHAPLTAGNFLKYVDGDIFSGASFYRIVTPSNQPETDVKISVIQGGLKEDAVNSLPPISHEPTSMTGLRHLNGAVSAARREAGAAGAFFICLGDQPQLDFGGARYADGLGFAAFGRVVEGMDVVERIWGQADDQPYLKREIQIVRASRRRKSSFTRTTKHRSAER